MSRKIWVDMTDLNVWSGHMTGVQRVVYQNAKRFAESSDYDAHYFVFDDSRKVFVEVSFEEISERIEASMERAEGETPAAPSFKQRLKRAPRAIVRRMPASVKRRVPTLVKRGLRKGARVGIHALRNAKHSAAKLKPVSLPPSPAITFEKGDIVLLMGKTWDLPDLMPTLGKLKMQQGFRIVHLVHDLIPIFEAHLFGPGLFEPYTRNMFEICSLSDGILANSKATKKDVERFCRELNFAQPPIQVVRLADDLLTIELAEDEPVPDPRLEKGNFILQVGTIEVRKNHQLTYMAYREAALRGIKLPIWVIMGGNGWLTGDVTWQMEHDPLVKDRIIILRGQPDRVRLWAYLHCRFTVSPSTYEGWGMPVSESLAYGKVCITSKTSSMPEIGGEYSDYVSPYNTQEMLDKLIEYTDDRRLKEREVEIKAGYKVTTWDQTFDQIDQFIQSKIK